MSNVLIAVIVTGLASAVVIAIAFIIHQRRLGRHRGGSREEFVGAFANGGIATDIPGTVYDYYKGQVISKDFSVSPDDDFEHVLSRGIEDIEDDAAAIMKKLGLRTPPDYTTVRSDTRIRTLRDMVHWLHWVRTHQPGNLRV
jgi:hypothetical protein